MPPEPSARDKARQIAEEATEHLAAELEAGRSEVLREYLAAMGRFHRYSWTNTLLIQSQRPPMGNRKSAWVWWAWAALAVYMSSPWPV